MGAREDAAKKPEPPELPPEPPVAVPAEEPPVAEPTPPAPAPMTVDKMMQIGMNCIKDATIADYKVTREKKAKKAFDEMMDVFNAHNLEPDAACLVLLAVKSQVERTVLTQIGLS